MGRSLQVQNLPGVKLLNYNVAQAAAALGVGKATIHALVAGGRFPGDPHRWQAAVSHRGAGGDDIPLRAAATPQVKIAANVGAATKKKLARDLAKQGQAATSK